MGAFASSLRQDFIERFKVARTLTKLPKVFPFVVEICPHLISLLMDEILIIATKFATKAIFIRYSCAPVFQQHPRHKAMISNVLVSALRVFRTTLVNVLTCRGTMPSIARFVWMSEWLQLHPHARLLYTTCQVNVFLIQILLRPDILVFSMQSATMSNAMHNWNTLASSVQRKRYLYDPCRIFIVAKYCFN